MRLLWIANNQNLIQKINIAKDWSTRAHREMLWVTWSVWNLLHTISGVLKSDHWRWDNIRLQCWPCLFGLTIMGTPVHILHDMYLYQYSTNLEFLVEFICNRPMNWINPCCNFLNAINWMTYASWKTGNLNVRSWTHAATTYLSSCLCTYLQVLWLCQQPRPPHLQIRNFQLFYQLAPLQVPLRTKSWSKGYMIVRKSSRSWESWYSNVSEI